MWSAGIGLISNMPHSRIWLAAIALGIVVLLLVFSAPILRSIGSVYIRENPLVKADIIVVLAGDGLGNRILKGAELAREGYAPKVLASSGGSTYGRPESDLAVDFAVQHGYSPNLFIPGHWSAFSTVEEAGKAIKVLRQRGAHKVIVVTTLWHTARSGRIYRRLAPDMQFYLVGAEDPMWHNGNWWEDREGRKTFFLEGVKTIADFLRI
jgi:uncharacterized SAM-binding protein YcdF (DUF218 family)